MYQVDLEYLHDYYLNHSLNNFCEKHFWFIILFKTLGMGDHILKLSSRNVSYTINYFVMCNNLSIERK